MRLKNSLLVGVFSLFMILACQFLSAQNTTISVEKSNEKVLIAGKVFYVHTVKKGETLYSIARAYNTSIDEISKNNPNMGELQVGQTIRIPDVPVKSSSQIEQEQGQVLHVVSAGQTIYAISRIYGVSVQDIESLNPELKYDSIQINQVIKIPLDKKKNLETGANFITHKVAEKETLYSLSKKYGISQEEIIKLNEPYLNNGLKIDQEIKIPVKKQEASAKQFEKPDHKCVLENLKIKYDSINISLMLPLFASGRQGQAADKEEESNEVMQHRPSEEFDPVSINFIEFYQGFALAASELKRKGLHIKISVFDSEKSTRNIPSLFEKASVKHSDIIVGPIYRDQITTALEQMQNLNSILVSPVAQHDKLTKKNLKLFQVNSGIETEYAACIEYLISDTSKNIIIIYKQEASATEDLYADFNSMLQSSIEGKNIKIKRMNVFNNDFSSLGNELDSLKENIVFSPVVDEIFVTAMFSQLDAKLLLYRIKAVALQDYLNYPSIDLDYFYDLQTVYFNSFYTNFQNDTTSNILKKYRLVYGTEPVRNSKYGFNYGLLGYNIAYYFITAYSYYGFEISNHSECLKNLPVTSQFEFKQTYESGGFLNKKLKKISFNKDYSLVEED